jgi:hypothetical protein
MEERLRSERPVHRAPENITHSVLERLPYQSASAPRRSFVWSRFAIGFAAIAAVAVLSVQVLRPPNKKTSSPQVAVGPSDALNLSIPEISTARFEQLTLHLNQPLEKELQNVISDTRVAIQFVAASFLPEK